MKKKMSLLLVFTLLITTLPLNVAFASPDSQDNTIIADSSDDSIDNKILVDTETITIEDIDGNDLDVVVEEYEELPEMLEEGTNDVSTFSLYREYKVGTNKSWVFSISNNQLGVAGITAGVPLSSAAKKKLTNAIVKLIGKKIGSALVPVVGWTSWVSTSAGIVNAAVGNTGFRASISGVYTQKYYNSGGYYVYNWKLNKPRVGTY